MVNILYKRKKHCIAVHNCSSIMSFMRFCVHCGVQNMFYTVCILKNLFKHTNMWDSAVYIRQSAIN